MIKSRGRICFEITESVYVDLITYDKGDLTPITLCSYTYFPVVDKFCYLGNFISRDYKDCVEITINRIRKAESAFGSLRMSIFFSRAITDKAKNTAYKSLALPIFVLINDRGERRKNP